MSVIRILLSLLVLLPIPGHQVPRILSGSLRCARLAVQERGGINNSGIAGAARQCQRAGVSVRWHDLHSGRSTRQRCHRSYRSS